MLNAQNSISDGAPPQTPLRELTALPQTSCWIWSPLRGRGRVWAGEDVGKREGKGREGGPPSYCWMRAPQRLAMPLCHFFSGI